MVDIESSKRVLSMLRRTKAALPDIMDRANQTGDYSEVDQAHKTMDRLLALGDQHIQAIKGAVGQDKLDGHDYAQNHPLAGDTPDAQPSQDISTGPQDAPMPAPPDAPSNLPSLDPQAAGAPHDGTPESTAHEAARGAAKGIIEAQKEQKDSLGYGPGDLSFKATGVEGYAPGELSYKSSLPPWKIPPPADEAHHVMPQSALPTDQEQDDSVFRDVISRYPAGSPERQSAIDDYFNMVREDSKLPRQEKPFDIMSLPPSPDVPQDEPTSALPTTEAPSSLPATEEPGSAGGELRDFRPDNPNPEEGVPILSAQAREQAAPILHEALKKNPAGTMQELQQYAANAPQWEREYLRRVAFEIGDRPKQSVFEKLAIALTLGAGSVIGAWVTGKYNGQALVDMNADQKDYDKRKAEIAKETYMANKGLEKAEIAPAASLQRTEMQEKGRGERLDKTEEGRGTRLDTTEGGKNTRLGITEKGRNDRQTEDLKSKERIAGIRAATTGKAVDRLSSGDRAKIEELKMQYNALDRMMLQFDPDTKAKGQKILDQIEAIIGNYPQKGK